MRRAALFVVAMLIGVSLSGSAQARTERKLTYRASQVWSTAVRFLRVDQGYKIVEKDKETGYLLFEYKDAGRTMKASLELIPAVDQGYKIVRARLRIEQMPRYVEAVLLDKFLRKLKDEYGAPPPAERVIKAAKQHNKPDKSSSDGKGSADDDEFEDEEDIEVDEDDLEDSVKEDD